MSERPDPQDPDRDPALDHAYRAADRDEPPARLDDAIRAAARREVGARPQSVGGGGLRAWRVPVSIAAMLVVGVSVVTLVREEHPLVLEVPPPAPSASVAQAEAEKAGPKAFEETARVKNDAARNTAPAKDAAAAGPAGKLATTPAEVPAQADSDDKARREVKRERRDQADVMGAGAGNVAAAPAQEPQRQAPQAFGAPETRAAEAPAPAVAAVPAPKPNPAPPAVADTLVQAAPRPDAPPLPAMKPVPPAPPKPMAKPAPRSEFQAPSAPAAEPPADVRMTQPAPPLAKAQGEGDYAGLDTPDKWLARIRELRKQGRLTEAARTLAEFRQRHPGYALPPDLVDGIKP